MRCSTLVRPATGCIYVVYPPYVASVTWSKRCAVWSVIRRRNENYLHLDRCENQFYLQITTQSEALRGFVASQPFLPLFLATHLSSDLNWKRAWPLMTTPHSSCTSPYVGNITARTAPPASPSVQPSQHPFSSERFSLGNKKWPPQREKCRSWHNGEKRERGGIKKKVLGRSLKQHVSSRGEGKRAGPICRTD